MIFCFHWNVKSFLDRKRLKGGAEMRVALLGFGTVGSAFYQLSSSHPATVIRQILDNREITGIHCRWTKDFRPVLDDPDVDTIVELIGGISPAYDYVIAAMKAGKNVVTANKALMSAYYDELVTLAEEKRVSLRCTAAAGGGIPWLHCLSRISDCDKVFAVSGIMNGTTNYILSAMTENETEYGECLLEAQRLGYAEADPTADVEGYDARRKLVLSANIAFGISLREAEIPCFGISGITGQDVAEFRGKGMVCKLIAHAENINEGVFACVEPMLYSERSQVARTNGADNLISLNAQHVGRQCFIGAGAGGPATASNVLADCIEIENGCPSFYTGRRFPAHVSNDRKQRYYIREGSRCRISEMEVRQAHLLAQKYKKERQPFFMAAFSEGEK